MATLFFVNSAHLLVQFVLFVQLVLFVQIVLLVQLVQLAKAHKILVFVLGKPENGGSEGQKSTKTPILCSGGANSWEKLRIRNRGDAYDYIDEDYKR